MIIFGVIRLAWRVCTIAVSALGCHCHCLVTSGVEGKAPLNVMGGRKGGNAEEGGVGYRVVQGVLTFSSSAQLSVLVCRGVI
jgi:hypothetical protein